MSGGLGIGGDHGYRPSPMIHVVTVFGAGEISMCG